MTTELVTLLLQRNKLFGAKFEKNLLVTFVAGEEVQEKNVRETLMDTIQVWSTYFQKCVMLRHIFCEDEKVSKITSQHLIEEFGHDLDLAQDRKHRPVIWDPILEACSSWFSWKMLPSNNDERTVLMHLVLETSATIFFKKAHKTISKYGETKYFSIHQEADEQHEKMGLETISSNTKEGNKKLFLIQQQGWDMINTLCTRIAKIALSRASIAEIETNY